MSDFVERYEPWREEAACKDADPDLFFAESRGASYEAARKLCGECAVQTECLQYALDINERYGFWGGTTERERRYVKGLEVSAEEYIKGKQNGVYTYRTKRGRPSKQSIS